MKKFLYCIGFLSLFFIVSACTKTVTFDSVIPDDGQEIGNRYASVTLTEYANFACPACANVAPLVDQVIEEMQGSIRVVYAHYPFALHGMTERDIYRLHNASECAADQGSFKEYHDLLYAKQNTDDFSAENIYTYADEIGVNNEQFQSCVDNMVHEEKIRLMKRRGTQFGVTSTPTLFINNNRFQFNQNSDVNGVDQLVQALKQAQQNQ